MGISIEEVKKYEKSFERSLDDTGINFITLRDYVNAKYIPKDQYEARLKADMAAMLTEIQLEIEELDSRAGYDGNGMPTFSTDYIRKKKVNEIIQQKIDKLKGE